MKTKTQYSPNNLQTLLADESISDEFRERVGLVVHGKMPVESLGEPCSGCRSVELDAELLSEHRQPGVDVEEFVDGEDGTAA